ncbi:MAG: hypothetical protein HWN80_12180 [Candidatus Lokiarchaeota archaeon]|nr:hypothetical protein [Candidatus Lokiarchaeota archaeon]
MEKKHIVGILSAIGGGGLVYDAIQVLIRMNELAYNLSVGFDLNFGDIGLEAIVFYINFVVTLLLGLIAVIFTVLTFLEHKYTKYPLFLLGVLAFVCFFIIIRPVQSYNIAPNINILISAIHLSTNGNTLNPFLLLLGGIFAIAVKEIKNNSNQ